MTDSNKAMWDALQFLSRLSKYLHQGEYKVAQSDEGLVTVFWNDPTYYMDLEFKGDGKYDLFYRDRVELAKYMGERDLSLDEISIESVDAVVAIHHRHMEKHHAV